MHYAKPIDDANPESCDRSSRLKANDIGFHVPDHILPDIISISDPKLHYSNYHAQRDRRLRRLIRRYTNQIQYGCRNSNCNTVTCLSYRKRNSIAPLRRYTEVSARTLACHLVEDYTRSGKDSLSGLCPNEPVVPWYEDPSISRKRRSSIEKPVHHRYKAQENGHPVKSAVATQNNKELTRHSPLAEHPVRRTSEDGPLQATRRSRNRDNRSLHYRDEGAENASLSPKRDEHNSKVGETSRAPGTAEKRDMASFTQTLFHLMPLKLLNWFPAASSPIASKPSVEDRTKDEKQDIREKHDPPAIDNNHSSTPEPENLQPEGVSKRHKLQQKRVSGSSKHSLRTITWDSAVWLRAGIMNSENYENNFFPFMTQSLSYCLSDPERLVATVRDFQGTYSHLPLSKAPPDSRHNESAAQTGGSISNHQPPTSEPQTGASKSWPMLRTKTRQDLEGLMMSLALLDDLQQRKLVLNSISVALQHSYALPSWLQGRRSNSRSSSTGIRSDHHSKADITTEKGNPRDHLIVDADIGPGISHEVAKPVVPLKDSQVTELCLVALLSLVALIFDATNLTYWGRSLTFARFRTLRNSGFAWPPHGELEEPEENRRAKIWASLMIEAIDMCEDWCVLDLLTSVMDVISHRLAVGKWSWTLTRSKSPKENKKTIVDLLISRFDRNALQVRDDTDSKPSWIGTAVIELARTIMLRKWDRNPIIQRTGPVGGALELLAGIYRAREDLHLDPRIFAMPFIADTFDDISMPSEWLSFRSDTRQMHLLSFSFLFEPATLVKYFRAINIEIMRKSHENAALVYNDTRHFMWTPAIPIYGAKQVLTHLRPHMAKYFVLTIRRDDLLNDAIGQIWRRERQELMRPLRVRLGKDEGEDGLDHGGVQQEFFRVAFAEAFQPDYGMFTVDDTTRMTWFQPGSFEPLYRFEALGILMSIAVYNGITLPVTFPLAFYRKLLDLKVKRLEHITDGWPDLAKGLQSLLDWTDGDVGDVIARTYEFSYEICGSAVTIDMQKVGRSDPWPPRKPNGSRKGKERAKSTSFELPLDPSELTPPSQPSPDLQPSTVPGLFPSLSRTSSLSIKGITTPISMSDSDLPLNSPSNISEAVLVTNANREQYVKDYVLWLTHKSISEQFEAFARGFYTCLDRTALSIFTAEALKSVIEGHPEIDIDGLERTTTYDDYTQQSQTIVDFWQIVRNMSPEQHRHLLEFVTASDRVPVNGMSSVTFIIQKNGDEDIRLPSSSTCYGRLLLPQYSSKEVMEEKLTKAIENCVGFGTL